MISAFGVEHGEVSKAWSAPRKQDKLSSALASEGAKRTPSQNPTVREDYLTARMAGAERGKSDGALGLRTGYGRYTKGERVEALAQHSRAVKNSRTRFEPEKARAQKLQTFYSTERVRRAKKLVKLERAVSKAYGRGPAMDAARWTAGMATGGAAGGSAVYGGERATGTKKKQAKRTASAAVLGGAAGQGVYQATGYEAKYRATRQHAKSGMSRAQTDKKLKATKKLHGSFTADMFRNYPKDMPGSKIHRVLGWTHRGRTGTAVGAAATLAGGAAAVKVARRTKEKQ